MSSDAIATALPDMERETDDDGPIETRPALSQLHESQLDALREFRDSGVGSRRELIKWLNRLQFRTLGEIPHEWFFRVVTDPVALSIMIPSQDWTRAGAEITETEGRAVRRRLVSRFLRPACRDAFRQLRPDATEWIEEDDGPIPDAETIDVLALRPALDSHLERQESVISEWISGMDSTDECEAWLHRLDRATWGEIKRVDAGFDHTILTGPSAPELWLDDSREWIETRERIVGRFLLPATNAAVRQLVSRSKEIGTDRGATGDGDDDGGVSTV
jgi:hypothetical protein